MSRLILMPLAFLLLLIVAAAVLAPLLLDKDKVLDLASTALHEKTGATLTIDGDVSLSVFPTLGVSLSGIGITLPGKQQPDVRARSLEIGVQLLPLLSGNVEIDTISLDGLTARIESAEEQVSADSGKLSDEQLDEFYTARQQYMAEAGAAAGAETVLAIPMALNVKHLTITDSHLELAASTAAEATVVELISLEVTGLNLEGQPVSLDLQLRLPGEQPIEVSANGNIRIDQQAQAITLDGVELAVKGATAQQLKLQTHGELHLSRQVADLQLTLESGEMQGAGTLRYASFESPQIDTQLQLNLFNPALLALVGPEATSTSSGETNPADNDKPLPLDAIRQIDTRADLSIAEARFDAHTVSNMQLKLRAVDGVVQIKTLTGDLHGGKLNLQATFNGKHNTATLHTSGGLTGMDIATALAALKSEPVLTGAANLHWQLDSKGRSENALKAALHGSIKLLTEEVVLQDMSVEQMVCQAVALTNKEQLTATFPPDTHFQTLGADIQLADGKAVLRPLRAELPEIALKGNGTFDLLSQDFTATFKASLSPRLEQLDHACRVSKRLTAIDWPVNCAGNVATEPASWCSVDVEEIITDLAVHEGKRKLQKKASKLLNKLFKK